MLGDDVKRLRSTLREISELSLQDTNKNALHRLLASIVLWSESLLQITKRSRAFKDGEINEESLNTSEKPYLEWGYQNVQDLMGLRRALLFFIQTLRSPFAEQSLLVLISISTCVSVRYLNDQD